MSEYVTTTNYGTWYNHEGSEESPEASLATAINGGDREWRERVETTGALERMAEDYRAAVQAALPAGVTLTGKEFIGPYYEKDRTWEGDLDIHAIIKGINLDEIVARHDPDNA